METGMLETGMLEIGYVIPLVVLFTDLIKRLAKRWLKGAELDPAVPIVAAVVLGVALNIVNLLVFGETWSPEAVQQAAKAGFVAAGSSMGLWSAGKAIVESHITGSVIHR